MPLELNLVSLAAADVTGIYGKSKRELPARMRFLHPAAATSFAWLTKHYSIVVSDMFRSPESSLAAVRAGRGAQPPGFSGHNFGFSIDLDVDAVLKKLKITKGELDVVMANACWQCHRRDHRRGREDWHYNFLTAAYIHAKDRTTAPALERKIQDYYGRQFELSARGAQSALKQIGLYSGELDGKIGPISIEAIRAFQRTWTLDRRPTSKAEYGTLGPITMRTLAVVAAQPRTVLVA